ncbi:mediator of RNA polymerase II transcription subunit 16-like isoform X5 [Camellia sinensis]|uniref:mediator of RNA polymerase II transcription subunit 16-like isoform X5 n=1 Tax=Camellia sinensis TaxID=4442 RepID=UPI00103674E2|nr:mediator of RNA polymerase II transcription subunit 16-like isoform X5 [Camellia sinensis]
MNSPSCVANQDPEEESTTVPSSSEATKGSEKAQDDGGCGGGEEVAVEDPMEVDAVNPATVFCIGLQQPRSNLMHKMSVPELCRNFSSVAWCGKLNAIACASETCARIPSSNANPPFWIPIHIVIPERPTECSVFNVIADSPRDSVQFMEWSPTSCPRALLIANFHGRITVWTQPSEGLPNPVRDASCWQREHEWRQDIAVVTKWLSGLSPYRWLSSRSSSSTNSKSAFEEKFLSLQPQAPGQYMSPYDPDEGPSITGWRVQRWESSLKPVVLHQIFGNPTSSFGGQPPMQTVWVTTVNKCIPPTNDFKIHQASVPGACSDARNTSDFGIEKTKRVCFYPFDLPSDVRSLARIEYSAHGGEIAVAFLRGGVQIFSGASFVPVDNYQINVGSAIAAPAFSSTSCCSASVWHDTSKDRTILKIIRVLPPAVPSSQVKANSSNWERAIAERFWWSLWVGVDWWDAIGCTQSAAEDGIVSLNGVIAVLDADFHSLPSIEHRQQHGPSLDRIKCRLLEGANAQEVRALVLDMQARLLLDMLGKGIESALINPSALVSEPWQESGVKLSGIDPEAMAVDPALVLSIQAYVDAVLDLASHFITRLRRYASFCRTLASHTVTASTGGNRSMVASPTQNSVSPATSQGGQGDTTSSTGSTQMQAWVQGAIAKISNVGDGVSNSTPNPITGPPSFMPISINTGTFPGTPAVRLIGDCHFLHRLCQLLLFCFFFRRTQLPRFIGSAQRNANSNMQKPQPAAPGKVEEINSIPTKPISGMTRSEEVQAARAGQVVSGTKGPEEGPANRSRLGSGNAGQGYTFEEVKVLFLILMDLCRRTAGLLHPLPVSQVGGSNIQVRLHYIDGNYTVLPEVVEASLGPHMQNMPRPRGADAAGLLLRELELHPPAEEWHRRHMFGGPWSDPEDMGSVDDPSRLNTLSDPLKLKSLENSDIYCGANGLWPRKRRMSERDAAFGLNTSVDLGAYLGIMGSRRDVVTAVWKTGLEGVWYKCIRCLRQTSAFASPGSSNPTNQNERERWWINRWAYGCPMCGGTWVRVV